MSTKSAGYNIHTYRANLLGQLSAIPIIKDMSNHRDDENKANILQESFIEFLFITSCSILFYGKYEA